MSPGATVPRRPVPVKDLGCHVAGEPTTIGMWPAGRGTSLAEATPTSPAVPRRPGFVCSAGPTPPSSAPPARPSRQPTARRATRGTRATTGGSSGGSAAAVAAGLVPSPTPTTAAGRSASRPASVASSASSRPGPHVSQGPDVGDGMGRRHHRRTSSPARPRLRPPSSTPISRPDARRPVHGAGPRPPAGRGGGRPRTAARRALDADRPGPTSTTRSAGRGPIQPGCCEALRPLTSSRGAGRMFDEHSRGSSAQPSAADTERRLRAFERMPSAARSPTRSIEPRERHYRRSAEDAGGRTTSGRGRGWARGPAAWASGRTRRRGFDLLLTPTLGARPRSSAGSPPTARARGGAGSTSFIPYTAQFNMTGQPAISLPSAPAGRRAAGRHATGRPVRPRGRAGPRAAARSSRPQPWADPAPRGPAPESRHKPVPPPPRLGRPRGVAQLGSAPALGAGGRRFKSCHPDFVALWATSRHPDRPSRL